MIKPPYAENENFRLEELLKYKILDTESEPIFDQIADMAAHICEVPTALISLVDLNRQWFKSKKGIDANETPREVAFCAHAILKKETLVVENALEDERFKSNPLVVDAPNIRFYAGAPLITKSGAALGTLCVIDYKPRSLDEKQKKYLETLASQVVAQFELRRTIKELQDKNQDLEEFAALASHDLKAPLRRMSMFADIILEDHPQSEPEAEEMLKKINSEASQLQNLIAGVLAYSRAGLENLEIEPVDVKKLLEEMKQQLSSEGNFEIEYIGEAPTLQTHRVPFQQIFSNLIVNSVKHSDKDQSIITISHETRPNHFEFRLRDNGPGIPKEFRKNAFKLFQSYSNKKEKSGVGLATVKKLVDMAGGEVWLSEEVGSSEESQDKFEICFTWPRSM